MWVLLQIYQQVPFLALMGRPLQIAMKVMLIYELEFPEPFVDFFSKDSRLHLKVLRDVAAQTVQMQLHFLVDMMPQIDQP